METSEFAERTTSFDFVSLVFFAVVRHLAMAISMAIGMPIGDSGGMSVGVTVGMTVA